MGPGLLAGHTNPYNSSYHSWAPIAIGPRVSDSSDPVSAMLRAGKLTPSLPPNTIDMCCRERHGSIYILHMDSDHSLDDISKTNLKVANTR